MRRVTRVLGRPLRGDREGLLVAALAVVLIWASLACAGGRPRAVPEHRPLRIAWINQGSARTEPWTAAHAAAARRVKDRFGSRVRVEFLENVDVGQGEATIDRLVRDGYRLIIATSFPWAPAMIQASTKYPNVRFEQARGHEVRANLGTFSGADEEPLFLAGMAAASTSPSGRLGFVGTVPEAETTRHIDAFALGAQSVNPSATVTVRWMGSWYDPDVERVLGEKLLAEGVDTLASGSVSTVLGKLAEDRGIGWVGHDADHHAEFPGTWLTGAVPNWGPYYVSVVRDALAGTWKPDAYYGSMADGYTDIATIGQRVPPAARRAIETRAAGFRSGALDVFTGPVVDSTGVVRVAVGAVLPIRDRWTIDWFVAGVRVAEG